MKTILLTGAAGRVGSALRPYLRSHYALRLFDRTTCPGPMENEEVIVGELSAQADVMRAAKGVAGIVHLARVHGVGVGFEETLDSNYRATLNLLEAAHRNKVGRFVFASSHHVLGQLHQDRSIDEKADVAPDSFYGLSKSFGEAACALYAHRYGISTLVIRIGNADPTVLDERRLRMWVSPRDLSELVKLGLVSDRIIHDVVYGVSICPRPFFPNERARELGYRPQDRAEDHLSPDFKSYPHMSDADGADYIGGAYAASPLPIR
ncbi:epimerase (plasmid) [Microvirga ossetica]|uniref:Epimerase n=1 Tax=Microvirga ossetica TaxID=1882682 RepID=A0A1B2EVT0_9HYPH|nr:NAD(P)-dependent oxidoreductase [Microvirga ossetica]ANY84061.1 epimerase [Microvirga ossetica]